MKRRLFLTGAASTVALPACAGAPETSARPVMKPADVMARAATAMAEQRVAAAKLGGHVGFLLADARTGEPLESRSPLRPLPPASVAKAVTALYALETLGPQHRFETRLVATGAVTGGRLDGDLVLVGGGDPALDSDGLHDLAGQARAAGITEITGKLLVYDGTLPRIDRIDRSQPDHVGYNPSVSGLNLNFNRVHFQWQRSGSSYTTTLDGRTERFRPDVTTSTIRIADRSVPVYTYERAGAVDTWTVARRQLGDNGARWLPVRNPALYAGDVLRTMLRAHGIVAPKVERTTRLPHGTVVARSHSAELNRVARSMLRFSTNLTAETLGLSSTMARGVKPTDLNTSADLMSRWLAARCSARRADFDDHSGLNDTSRVSPVDMVKALTAPRVEQQLRPVLREMTVGDAAPIRVRAKTGTLNFVSGLAGYFPARSGRMLTFAIFCADVDRRNGLSVAERERPQGGRAWSRRARALQRDLIEQWAAVHT